jgi:Alpha/beta hydrolase family
MSWKTSSATVCALLLGSALSQGALADPPVSNPTQSPVVIKEQGSFAAGGNVLQSPGVFDPKAFISTAGGTLHGDHAYVQFQIPPNARNLPLVMWHGGGQMGKTWESTPDGREGFQTIFLRRGFAVYILDQPRRGRAGQTTVGTTITPSTIDQSLFIIFRLGIWPNFFPGSQFPHTSNVATLPVDEPLNQYFRQITPDTGPSDPANGTSSENETNAVSALFDKIGPGVLITHSASGILGWQTAIKNGKIKAIVAYEPTVFVYPQNEPAPPPGFAPAVPVPAADFDKLTKIPIQIVFGDNIPNAPTPYAGLNLWVNAIPAAQAFVATLKAHGGDAEVLRLPDKGLHGNTHFPFSDMNNVAVADLLSQYLKDKGLDKRGTGNN